MSKDPKGRSWPPGSQGMELEEWGTGLKKQPGVLDDDALDPDSALSILDDDTSIHEGFEIGSDALGLDVMEALLARGALFVVPGALPSHANNALFAVLADDAMKGAEKLLAVRYPLAKAGSLVAQEILGVGHDADGALMVLQSPAGSKFEVHGESGGTAQGRAVLVCRPSIKKGEYSVALIQNQSSGATGEKVLFRLGKEELAFGGDLVVGKEGNGTGHSLFFSPNSTKEFIRVDAHQGMVEVVRPALKKDGSPMPGGTQSPLALNGAEAEMTLGSPGRPGRIVVTNSAGEPGVELAGKSGDVLLYEGADYAEEFKYVPGQTVEPGMVVVAVNGDVVEPTTTPYDKRVVGVVSGAGGLKPGIVMDRRSGGEGRVPVALAGKVYCRVDASLGAIEVGDLLVASSNRGYAMRAETPVKAMGASIGKALEPLAEGRAEILVLAGLK